MSSLSQAEPTDLSDPDQLRELLFDEWKCSCPIFGGDPKLLSWLEKKPWYRTLPQLVRLAVQTWWVFDVERTPGMQAIAEFLERIDGGRRVVNRD